jgi:hypothetical protein
VAAEALIAVVVVVAVVVAAVAVVGTSTATAMSTSTTSGAAHTMSISPLVGSASMGSGNVDSAVVGR